MVVLDALVVHLYRAVGGYQIYHRRIPIARPRAPGACLDTCLDVQNVALTKEAAMVWEFHGRTGGCRFIECECHPGPTRRRYVIRHALDESSRCLAKVHRPCHVGKSTAQYELVHFVIRPIDDASISVPCLDATRPIDECVPQRRSTLRYHFRNSAFGSDEHSPSLRQIVGVVQGYTIPIIGIHGHRGTDQRHFDGQHVFFVRAGRGHEARGNAILMFKCNAVLGTRPCTSDGIASEYRPREAP